MTQKNSFLSRFTPSLMTPEALESIFVQRQGLAQQILDRIRTCVAERCQQHTLVVGPRGIGKTHLISLIYYRLQALARAEERLSLAWLREEEWEVTSYLDLLVRLLQALAAEQEKEAALATRLNSLFNLSPERAEIAAEQIIRELAPDRTLVILMENMDELLLGMGQEGRLRFRRFLRDNSGCVLVASSQCALDEFLAPGGTMLPGKCHVHAMEELSHEDALHLLAKIAAYRGDRELATFLATPRGLARMRALKYLAGGNHRAYVIFSQFLTRESLDDIIEPLMRTIDDLTPYYQARMAWFSPEQRKLIAFICECRHPVPLREIARHCFLKAEAVSSHLEALRKLGHLRAFSVGADQYYELREPLMRLSIEVKKHRGKPVRLLVDFLRLWYSPAELQQRLAALPPEAVLERAYALPALEISPEESRHPRLPVCCAEYRSAIETGDFPRALRAAEELVTLRGQAEDLSAQGFCLQNLGRHKEALDCYDRLIALKPEDPLPWLLRGSALTKLARHQDALSSCEKAIELNPRESRAWNDRGAIFLSSGRTDDALACFEKVTELEPENAFGWISRGMALSDLGCFQESLASFARAADLDPGNEMAHIYCCAAFIELKDFERALAHVDRALEIAPDHPLAWAVRSTALAAAGRYRDALHAVERALELGEGSSFLYFKRAEILFAEDRWREGSTALDEALGRFYRVENPDAGNTVAIIRLLQRFLHDESGLRLRIKVLVLTYYKHKALPTLAHALVEFIPDLLTPAFQDHTAHRWLDQWRGLTETRPEFRLPLRLVAAAASYRETRDLRVLMELPLEERILLEPLLGVEVQATA